MNKRRLRKLAAFLEKLPASKFDLEVVVTQRKCGTVACAMGWTPAVFPRLCRWEYGTFTNKPYSVSPNKNNNTLGIEPTAKRLFGINATIIEFLFMPYFYPISRSGAKSVAKRIRALTSGKITTKSIRSAYDIGDCWYGLK